jgi:tetratricopeptide (TPR) repeat protein
VSFAERGQLARAVALVERGIALATGAAQGQHVEGRGHAYLLRLFQLDGEVSRSLASARRLLELATAGGDRVARSYALANLAATQCDAGELDAAAERIHEATRLALESESELAIGLVHAFLAKFFVFRGEPERALEVAELAGTVSERAGQVSGVYTAAMWRGYAHLLLGDSVRAAAEFERMGEINASWPSALEHRAHGRLALRRWQEAVELARECLAQEPPRLVRARILCTLARAMAAGEPGGAQAAEAALLEAVSLCDELGLRPQLAESHLALSEVCARRGDPARALYFAERALRGFESCGMTLHARLATEALQSARRLAGPARRAASPRRRGSAH